VNVRRVLLSDAYTRKWNSICAGQIIVLKTREKIEL